ncbi:hypothetical protein [Natronobacterium gregoryi]|uniref:Uncharacterized protein n=2 Tax=Natronobacterium gregoryi TaxID=44930 RepID=L0AIT6_NATGS|nr:hypothetical protein [Natronobacterium gregoryi]AFZ73082.1 hypothetical protein Natgr_1897 [Natronobacterium gregoryi SP2]PLK20397.1 hypothetical protein CYV19_09730 [Natronobacterium gregoryi SP2]SFI61554.1 hypothetical protein SAMN05443661_102184 [Natronobacterium gregoryi]
MSQANYVESNDDLEPDDGIEALEDHRELFERIADSNLPAAEHFQRALERAESKEGDGDV